MKRREFIKLTTISGISVLSPLPLLTSRLQAGELYEGPFFVSIGLAGGANFTDMLDPKGAPIDSYDAGAITSVGNFRVAPTSPVFVQFMQKYFNRIMVINGIDMRSNAHDAAVIYGISGKLGRTSQYPCMASCFAAVKGQGIPAPLMQGGWARPGKLIAPTRIARRNTTDAFINVNHFNGTISKPLHEDEIFNLVLAEAMDANEISRAAAKSPALRERLEKLFKAQSSQTDLRGFGDYLPEVASTDTYKQQMQQIAAAFKSGVSAAATTFANIRTFDTHDNHNVAMPLVMNESFDRIDFLIQELERHGIADKTYIFVTTDFGRTAGLNPTNGKDHWPVGSMMVMGPGISGNRVVGATDNTEALRPQKINAQTGALDANGITIVPELVLNELRKLTGIADDAMLKSYSLGTLPAVRLFT